MIALITGINAMRKRNKTLWFELVTVMVLAIATVSFGSLFKNRVPNDVYAAGGTATISFTPASTTLPGLGNTNLQVTTASTNDKIGAVNINVIFDTTKINLASEPAYGTSLTQILPGNTTMAEANTTGKLTIHLGIAGGNTANAPTGAFTVSTLNWKAVTTANNQTTQVTIDTNNSTVADLVPQYLPIVAQSLNININPAPTITPTTKPSITPTTKPSNTPTPRPSITPTTRPSNTPSPRPSITPTTKPSITPVTTVKPTDIVPTTVVSPTPGNSYGMASFNSMEDKTIYIDNHEANVRTLVVDGQPATSFLMKFYVRGLEGKQVISAKLRLFSLGWSFNGGSIYTTTNNWSEGNLVWANAPAAYTWQGNFGWTFPQNWSEVDIHNFIVGNGVYSFRVISTSVISASYSSAEGGWAPQLVVTYR